MTDGVSSSRRSLSPITILAAFGFVVLLLVVPLILGKFPLRWLPIAFSIGAVSLAVAGILTAIADGRARPSRLLPWVGAGCFVLGALLPLCLGVPIERVFYCDRLGLVFGFVLAWFGASSVLRSGRSRGLRRALPTLFLVTLAMHLAWGLWRFFWRGEDRMTGLVAQPNFFATIVLTLAFPFVLPALGARRFDTRAGCAIAATLIALVCSGSRAGLGIALIVALGYAFASGKTRKTAWLVGLGGVVLALLLAIVPNPLKSRLERNVDASFPRTFIWERAARVAVEHPAGVGLGMFRWYFAQDAWMESAPSLSHRRHEIGLAHNAVLGAAAEAGIAGGIGVSIWIVGFAALALSKRRGRLAHPNTRAWYAAAAVLVLHALVDGVAQSMAALGPLAIVVAMAESKLVSRAPRIRGAARLRSPQAAAALLVLMAIVPNALAFEVGRRMRKGAEAQRALNFAAASAAFRSASRVIGDHAPAAYARANLARLAFETDRSARTELEIEVECAGAARANPFDAKPFVLLGDVRRAFHFAEGRSDPYLLERALRAYDAALAIDPLALDVRLTRARLLRLLGALDLAAADLDEVVRREPFHALAYQSMGDLELERGNKDAAVSRWLQAIHAWLDAHSAMQDGRYGSGEYLVTLFRGFDPKVCEARIRETAPG